MKNLIVTELDRVAYIKLHRPEVRNAFNPEMIAEITAVFTDLAQRKDLLAIAISGEGKSFCAGADLAWMKEMVQYDFARNLADSEKLFEMFSSIELCPHPVVALVHGSVFGGALGILACCDYVIAEETTQFCFSEVKLGLVPAVISGFVLKKAHRGYVQPLMMSGQLFSAHRAHNIGLVHEIFNLNSEKDIAHQMNHQLGQALRFFKAAGPESVRSTKKLLQSVEILSSSEQKKETTKVIAERRVSAEGQEGLRAFLEKRETRWPN